MFSLWKSNDSRRQAPRIPDMWMQESNYGGLVPRVIYIISDMEFDQCATGADETAFENAKRKWKEAGLELPTVVFWNVDARSDDVPATKFDKNVTLISGSNQNAFRFAMEGKTPEQLMHEVIDSDRYKHIKA